MKILHTADIHFGSNAYGRIDPETGLNTRLLDFKKSFDFLVEKAIEEDIDLFLFAGDAYRTADPTPTQQKAFAECLRPIAEKGIPIVMIVGNHDHPVSYGKASALDIFPFLEGDIHVFRKADLATIETKAGPLQLIALPWPIRSMLLAKEDYRKLSSVEIKEVIEEKYLQFLQAAVGELDPNLPTVLTAHLTVQGAALSGSEQTSLIAHEPKFTVGQLGHPEIDYVALGHIHRYQDRHEGEHPPIVYSGSIEYVSFKEWDHEKGFVIVDIDVDEEGKKSTSFSFIPTPARPFVAIDIDARDSDEATKKIVGAIKKAGVKDGIVRVRYQVGEDHAAEVDLAAVRKALKKAHAIAAIERIAEPVERERRTVVTRESTLEEALRHYIAQHEHLGPIEDAMIQKALELEASLDNRS